MRFFLPLVVLIGWSPFGVCADTATTAKLNADFQQVVRPFLTTYCLDCHGAKKQEAKLNLTVDDTLAPVTEQLATWDVVAERLQAGDMPPESAEKQPGAQSRQAVIAWIHSVSELEATRNAGDPGIVLAHRLSNSEYDNTIRDLTGYDLRPTREFPVDPANEAGFDNTGESLTVSPALVKKHLEAARFVASHAVLTPKGIVFAPYPVLTETDRDQFCVQQIVEFYRQHEVDYADYFAAAWRFQHRARLGAPKITLPELARATRASKSHAGAVSGPDQPVPPRGVQRVTPHSARLSERYLQLVWFALTDETTEPGPLAELQAKWRQLTDNEDLLRTAERSGDGVNLSTTAQASEPWQGVLRTECESLRDFVIELRKKSSPRIEKLHVKGMSDGSQPLVLWWNRQQAVSRMSSASPNLSNPSDVQTDRFCRVFPNTFAVSSRGHYADPNLGVGVRLLTAGFHLMQGYFRDDAPLYELVLTDDEKAELDSLWKTLNFVTQAPIRQYKDFLFFERAEPPGFAAGPEFDFARPENKDVTTPAVLDRVRDLYVAKANRLESDPRAIEAIETYFEGMSAAVRELDQTAIDVQTTHLESLKDFATRCARRPLSRDEAEDLTHFYRKLRDEEGLGHDDAVRDVLTSVLMSPTFCYRFDTAPTKPGTQALSDYELASRLSYFLWSSLPDAELLDCAARGDLHRPEVLLTQSRRMLRDARIRGLASEFAGNWLEIRRFEEHNSVDRERFPAFTNELRAAMYEEPLRLVTEIVQENRPVLELILADYTFANPVLAKHYGLDVAARSFDDLDSAHRGEWFRVNGMHQYGRGGLLTMSVFLTRNSPGLRTSPVKRGYWVVRRLLGERIPAPPPDVPELPKDEASLGELTLPQLLARHRDHRACASCHQRFDSIGLVFEGFGPIGERRERDSGGRAVETAAIFPDGTAATGVTTLRQYVAETRRDDFLANFCRKLLSYALGRSLLPSDKFTIEEMRRKLAANDDRIQTLFESIVTCPQFLNKRGIR